VRANVSRETQEALERFASLLLRWNRTVNLISRSDEQYVWQRHIDDSLQLLPLMEPLPSHAIDLGPGAGFPGLVLALASDVHFALIEADRRKCAFLREAARVTGAPVQIHAVRIESASLRPAPLVTARALAPLPRLLELAAPLLAAGGQCLFLKGANAAEELTHTSAEWQMQVDRIVSRTDPHACILRICNPTRVLSSA
jgi:16S rRNA (guanine527-N7)-methyltransferase